MVNGKRTVSYEIPYINAGGLIEIVNLMLMKRYRIIIKDDNYIGIGTISL